MTKQEQEDLLKVQAHELTLKVHEMHLEVYNESLKKKTTFDKCLELKQFDKLSIEDMDVLKAVEPFRSVKQLVKNINSWDCDLNQLDAFETAIRSCSSLAIIEEKQL